MLYIISGPIGNLGDITLRAIEILKSVDIVLCEDTRRTALLLNKYSIKKKLLSYHKFNERKELQKIIHRLLNNTDIAYLSDAGTPLIADPGSLIIRECLEKNIPYTSLPGPSSLVNSIVLAGIKSRNILFVGFFPDKLSDRIKIIELIKLNLTVIFYINPKNINSVMKLFVQENISGKIILCREMTKIYEEIIEYQITPDFVVPEIKYRGEITVIFVPDTKKKSEFPSPDTTKYLYDLSSQYSIPVKEITKLYQKLSGNTAKNLYNDLIRLKNNEE